MKLTGKILIWVLGLGILFGLIEYFRPYGIDIRGLIYAFKVHVYWVLINITKRTFSEPLFYGCVGAILILERIFPAKKTEKIFSVNFFQDMVWLIVTLWLKFNFIYIYIDVLRSFYQAHLSYLTIHSLAQGPFWLIFPCSILFSDFLGWFNHYIRHKVPVFWCFHTIHHSQEHLNMFTDLRYHVVEYIIDKTLRIIPLLILGLNPSTIVAFNLFHSWYTRTYHANIKSNYGFLRYILVTPQSHRVHHSCEPAHQDKNFGILFSIWDHMFRTQYTRYDEYPDTGITDEDFPVEKSFNPISLILTPVIQHIYPFRVIARDIRKKFRKQSS